MITSTPDPSAPIRRNAATIAAGLTGVSTLALLAVGSIIPLFAGTNPAPAIAWLGGLGTNALASWLDQWARANLTRARSNDRDAERKLLEDLARDLQAQLAANDSLAADMATLLEHTRAIPIALDALQGQGESQTKLLRLLLEDVQRGTIRNERLHDVTLRTILEQSETLHDVIARSDATLLAEIRALRPGDTVQGDKVMGDKAGGDKVGGDKIRSGGILIGGSVGTMQSVTITDGTVSGPIIGSQTTYYGAPPAASSTAPAAVSQEDIDEQQELVTAHRRTLAVYLRRLAKLGDAHAPPEISHGIREARNGIRHVKATLRGWGVASGDHPDDEGKA
ncbi:MAG: hypothetical protein M3R61_00420 [Chloroflexota bacterium]|nr:hypothetical protein [Chloroflexota bacterium]